MGDAVRSCLWSCLVGLLALCPRTGITAEAGPETLESLARLPLQELARVEVSSVSKSPEPLAQAPAAIYVIGHDEIMRSGASNLAEALRLAPNLQFEQLSASSWVAAPRGFGTSPFYQAFANKLLVLIDGRSVYNPLFSGLYLDELDVLLDDVDRIEVISGPGATLWGANAVNGVVNVITRPAYQTRGALGAAAAGNLQQQLRARYGDRIGEDLDWRIYGLGFQRGAEALASGAGALDSWRKAQGGFRADWSRSSNRVTIQGDAYREIRNDAGRGGQIVSGANLLARWQHRWERSELALQAYFDQRERDGDVGGDFFVLHTWDLQLQHNIESPLGRIVWGAGERVNQYAITNNGALIFAPNTRALTLANIFAEDNVRLGPAVELKVGAKLEDDPYAGWQLQPEARLSWTLSSSAFAWLAAARAIRAPTPFDVDVIEKFGGTVFITGNAGFHPEQVTSYEAGLRGQPLPEVSFSLSAFDSVYRNLRSIEPDAATGLLPVHWGNGIEGHTYGVEGWLDWRITARWRLSPGVRTLHEALHFAPGASGLFGIAQAGNDPWGRVLLKSSLELSRSLSLDLVARWVGALPDPALPSHWELNGRLGWRVSPSLSFSISGTGLLHERHLEYPAPYGAYIRRSVMAELRWAP